MCGDKRLDCEARLLAVAGSLESGSISVSEAVESIRQLVAELEDLRRENAPE